jgi:hypothetical protein
MSHKDYDRKSSAWEQAAADVNVQRMRLVWDGLQPARTWIRRQRNIRLWKPLPSNVTENTSLRVIVIWKSIIKSCVLKCPINPITNRNSIYNQSRDSHE